MENLEERSKKILKAHEKVMKIVDGLDSASALAVINFTFLKMVLNQTSEPISASAMTATFMRNVLNSIDNFYLATSSDELIH